MRRILTLVVTTALTGAACGGGEDAGEQADDRPLVVTTTSVLGDVVDTATGGLIAVEVVMPRGADPHDFAPSAKAASEMEDADLVVAVGGGFEAGMGDVIDAVAAGGTPVVEVVDLLGLDDEHADDVHADDEHVDDEHADDEHVDDEHADDVHADDEHVDDEHADDEADDRQVDDDRAADGHDHGGVDPHVWTDPVLMIEAVEALGVRLAALDGIDADELARSVDRYLDELAALDADIDAMIAEIPPERRVLVTNHEVFGYFADRYGFEVVGAVVPSLTTNAESSARELEQLADTIRSEKVPAIFVETTQSTRLAEALAAEVGDEVGLVELYTESLGEPDGPASTYVDMMRYDAEAIAEALRS